MSFNLSMNYELKDINSRIISDPIGFVEECDAIYAQNIEKAADMICENIRKSPIVLLSGPSGSGKTTTAMKIEEELRRRGVGSHSIAMDNYYLNVGEDTPKTPEGDYDFESPLCLDLELLNEHFTALNKGEKIIVPKYEFARQMRILKPSKALQLKKDEIAIFEGIHALNSMLTDVHPEAFKLYISARSNFISESQMVFKGTWVRLMRRIVRDNIYRGADPSRTMSMWANVRRGEKQYISPYKDEANLRFNTELPYEVSVMKTLALGLFDSIENGTDRYEELRSIPDALDGFVSLDERFVADDSLLREFIGGGVYDY